MRSVGGSGRGVRTADPLRMTAPLERRSAPRHTPWGREKGHRAGATRQRDSREWAGHSDGEQRMGIAGGATQGG